MLFGFDDSPAAAERANEAESTSDDPTLPEAASGRRWPLVVVGIVGGLVLALGVWALASNSDESLTQDDVDQAIADALEEAVPAELSASDVYDQIAPSLVIVRARGSDPDEPANLGAGVIINDRGQVLTANHVLDGAITLELGFSDGSTTTAEIDSENPDLDMAVLNPLGGGLRVPVVLGNSRTLAVGDQVYAVGNPLGLVASISSGVISGLERDIPMPGEDELVFEDLIQFDAAVNQGSSGGPLLNAEGQVIGIVTALADPTGEGFFVGIGFAVPIDAAVASVADGPSQ